MSDYIYLKAVLLCFPPDAEGDRVCWAGVLLPDGKYIFCMPPKYGIAVYSSEAKVLERHPGAQIHRYPDADSISNPGAPEP